MTREELSDYLDTVLSQAADGPPEGPRPQGRFFGSPSGSIDGLRMVAPDGSVFYVAVLDIHGFAINPEGFARVAETHG